MDLTEDDVLQILNIIEKSHFDFLELDLGELKLTVSKGSVEYHPRERMKGDSAEESAASAGVEQIQKDRGEKQTGPEKPLTSSAATSEDTVPITAPMVGTFYVAPEPGAPPYVQQGARVEEESTVGLIEVMKVFNAVTARVRGVVAEICVENGQFVEFGETLFRVRPE